MDQTAKHDVFERQGRVEAAAPEQIPLSDIKLAAAAVDGVSVVNLPGRVTLAQRKGRYRPERQAKLRNSLLAGVGLLELANACDFAANVWNEIPVPIYAMVLMAAGGTLALGIISFAVRDALLSWQNVVGLRAERRHLRAQRRRHRHDAQAAWSVDCWLDVNFRETGTELVDRVGMDAVMGFGALMVGTGTLMAMGGADRAVFQASNLLSGYIGNAPCAAYGVANLAWSAYVWRRAHRHSGAAHAALEAPRVQHMLRMRTFTVEVHGAVNGITGIVAGAASLVTATMWWGYVVLVPCVVTSILLNYLWRHRIGYDRPFVYQVVSFDKEKLVAELAHLDSCRQRLRDEAGEPLSGILSDATSISCALGFIVSNNLFEEFGIRLLRDKELSTALCRGLDEDSITIDSDRLAAVDDAALRGRILETAQSFIRKASPKCFDNQERYLLEALGSYMCTPGRSHGGKAPVAAEARQTHHNVHTDCGRHGDAWLFGTAR